MLAVARIMPNNRSMQVETSKELTTTNTEATFWWIPYTTNGCASVSGWREWTWTVSPLGAFERGMEISSASHWLDNSVHGEVTHYTVESKITDFVTVRFTRNYVCRRGHRSEAPFRLIQISRVDLEWTVSTARVEMFGNSLAWAFSAKRHLALKTQRRRS